jgi:hypothetical protein
LVGIWGSSALLLASTFDSLFGFSIRFGWIGGSSVLGIRGMGFLRGGGAGSRVGGGFAHTAGMIPDLIGRALMGTCLEDPVGGEGPEVDDGAADVDLPPGAVHRRVDRGNSVDDVLDWNRPALFHAVLPGGFSGEVMEEGSIWREAVFSVFQAGVGISPHGKTQQKASKKLESRIPRIPVRSRRR